MNIRNVKLRFNLDKPEDRRAYEYLQQGDRSQSKMIISAVCRYLDLSETKALQDAFLERVVSAFREEAAKINPFRNLLQIAPQSSPAEKEEVAETEEAMLDFLDNF